MRCSTLSVTELQIDEAVMQEDLFALERRGYREYNDACIHYHDDRHMGYRLQAVAVDVGRQS
jgi:hypothetical protein